MVFSSLSFLYLFLPITVLLYFICKNRTYRNIILLIASILFYALGEPKYVILMLLASFVAYVGGLFIHHFDRPDSLKIRKTIFIITCILLISNLFIFKYLNFTIDNIEFLIGRNLNIKELVLPIGISFYTFKILSYVIDLYRHNVHVQKNYLYLTLYLAFFPQLIAGPIVRYQTIEDEILHRKESLKDIIEGTRRFIIGLSKKVLLANTVANISVIIYEGDTAIYGSFFYWIAAISYALQIYFDFSGYSDMAIGLGKIFGFHFLENFDYPYTSLSITEFWRRWHISLSTWFRDYIYIPLGGNRVGKARHIFNILIVWCLTGFWHGAQWNFIIWGLYYGILLILEKQIYGKLLDKLPKVIRYIYTAFFVLIGWVIFNLVDFNQMLLALKMMFSFTPTDWIGAITTNSDILTGMIYLPLAIIAMLPWAKKIRIKDSFTSELIKDILCGILLVLSVAFILSSSYNPFIYFRF